jgi:hypothetical protein
LLAGTAMSLTRHVLADAISSGEAECKNYEDYRCVRHVPPFYATKLTREK